MQAVAEGKPDNHWAVVGRLVVGTVVEVVPTLAVEGSLVEADNRVVGTAVEAVPKQVAEGSLVEVDNPVVDTAVEVVPKRVQDGIGVDTLHVLVH